MARRYNKATKKSKNRRSVKKRKGRMKAGREFEIVVAEVAAAMDPGAAVVSGEWVEGPDGRRDKDVQITTSWKGRLYKILVECKDYNPSSTGPVGIDKVDALDSKRLDLKVDVAMICSNAGFTEPARRKALRVGIRLVSVMKEGDSRVRFQVSEEFYVRDVSVEHWEMRLRGPAGQASLESATLAEITYLRLPIANWVRSRLLCVLSRNPIVNWTIDQTFDLTQPLEVQTANGSAQIEGIDISCRVSGNWYRHDITIDSTQGMYDCLRRSVLRAPVDCSVYWRGVNFDAGELVDCAPDWAIAQIYGIKVQGQDDILTDEETTLTMMGCTGLGPIPTEEQVPPVQNLMKIEELGLEIPELPRRAMLSKDSKDMRRPSQQS